METIYFDNCVPEVFQHQSDLNSEVWGQQLTFQRGGLYLVEAESGKGKSTFCSYILGYRNDFSGRLMFDDRDTRSMKVKDWVEVRRTKVAHLFQELRLFPELTAWENVRIKNTLASSAKGETCVDESRVKEWFHRLGIADKTDTQCGRMSFGQQQRVAMMRALAQPFDFLLVDEPISHLDDRNSAIMAEIMMEEARQRGAGVIVTSIGKHMNLDYERVVKL